MIMPKPTKSIMQNESGGMGREKEKAMSAMPKALGAMTMSRLRPMTDFSEASYRALMRVPMPDAPIRKPWVLGPPYGTSRANIGIRTIKGIPIKLVRARRSRAYGSARNRKLPMPCQAKRSL